MNVSKKSASFDAIQNQGAAIRYLVESALQEVVSVKRRSSPRSREEWIAHLCETLMSDSEASHHAAIAALMANGIGEAEMLQSYIPDVARHLGQMWVRDEASFVDVTVAASRLQQLFRSRPGGPPGDWQGRSIPLGHAVLMVIPQFEGHSLGAFVAADGLRRHGLWVHMGIGLNGPELAEMASSGRFSMVGVTLSSPNSVEKAAELIDFVRHNGDRVPPIVVGGRAVKVVPDVAGRTGADHAVHTVREAVEKSGLSTAVASIGFDEVCQLEECRVRS